MGKFRDLFIVNENEKPVNDKRVNEKPVNTFVENKTPTNFFQTPPQAVTTQSTTSTGNNVAPISCEPYMDKIYEMYESGFNSLNMEGYDFYEFYKSMVDIGNTDPNTYKLAFNMAKGFDKNISKEKLISQADYYIGKINEVHQEYVTDGNNKKNSIINDKSVEGQNLNAEISNIEKSITEMQNRLVQLKMESNNLDNKYSKQLHDIECKLMGNNMAKDKLLNSINNVKMGINNNV